MEKNHCYCQVLSIFNYGSFSQITIPTSNLGWRKGYEEASKIGITGIAEKVAKDPDRYCKLQSHFPEKTPFIDKQFSLVHGPLYHEFNKQHNALKADWNPTSKKILT
ncbi:hypothetical protein VP01_1115g1, partial [Puccinia sorghi]